jgi:hypothetical protein
MRVIRRVQDVGRVIKGQRRGTYGRTEVVLHVYYQERRGFWLERKHRHGYVLNCVVLWRLLI